MTGTKAIASIEVFCLMSGVADVAIVAIVGLVGRAPGVVAVFRVILVRRVVIMVAAPFVDMIATVCSTIVVAVAPIVRHIKITATGMFKVR